MMAKILAGVAATMVAAQPAMAQQAGCISADEMNAAARFLVPTLVDGVTKKCTPVLGPESYLSTQGDAFSQRFMPQKGDDALLASLLPKLDKKGTMKGVDIAMLKAVAGVEIAKGMAKDLKPDACAPIDKVLKLMDPLPPENLVGLIAVILQQVEQDKKRKSSAAGGANAASMMSGGDLSGSFCTAD